jgi:hypothetical protein
MIDSILASANLAPKFLSATKDGKVMLATRPSHTKYGKSKNPANPG